MNALQESLQSWLDSDTSFSISYHPIHDIGTVTLPPLLHEVIDYLARPLPPSAGCLDFKFEHDADGGSGIISDGITFIEGAVVYRNQAYPSEGMETFPWLHVIIALANMVSCRQPGAITMRYAMTCSAPRSVFSDIWECRCLRPGIPAISLGSPGTATQYLPTHGINMLRISPVPPSFSAWPKLSLMRSPH